MMGTSVTWSRNQAFFKVLIIDDSGAIVGAPQSVSLKVGGAYETAQRVLTLVEENGGSQSSTVASELQRNEQRVAEVLNLLKGASTGEQVGSWNVWLNEFLNYADALQGGIQEGSIHFIRSLDSQGHPSFFVMFAPYGTPGGAMKPRVVANEEELRDFLVRGLGVDAVSADKTLTELENQQTVSLPNVVLSVVRQRTLGLL